MYLYDGIIALGDSLALLPYQFSVHLGTEDTSVLVHPHQRESQEFQGDVTNVSLISAVCEEGP